MTGSCPKILVVDDEFTFIDIREIIAHRDREMIIERFEMIEPEIRRSEKRNYPTLKESLRQNRRVKPGTRRK